MKKTILFCLCLLLICLVIVFIVLSNKKEMYTPEKHPFFNDKLKSEIENAWLVKKNEKLTFRSWFSEENPAGLRFYGTYNDFSIIFAPGELTAVSEIEIADHRFVHSCSFNMYAYSKGELYELKEVYENGWIKCEYLTKILDVHRNFIENN